MSKTIWVRKGQQVRGPFSAAQIHQLAEAGKLTDQHEISSDQKRWKPAREIAGLEVSASASSGELSADEEPGGSLLPAVAASHGGQFALGVLLLVVIGLMVTGTCLLKLGIMNGLVFSLLFLLTAALGYPAACLGRDVSGIYVVIMAVVCVMLLGETPNQFGTSLDSWMTFAGGLLPGVLIVLGWNLVTRGLGHDNEMAEMARLNPSRFSSSPLPARELERALSATADSNEPEHPKRVKLRLDPDDLDRAEETLGHKIEQEARRSVPGLAVSFVIHALLLLGFAIWQLKIFSERELTLELGWKTISAREQTEIVPPEKRNIDLQAVQVNQQPAEPKELKPLQPVNPGVQQQVPVKPVDVKNLFDGRSEENRQRIFEEVDEGQRVEIAISLGLGWLTKQQQPAGNWQLHTGYPDACEWPDLKTDTGATALALLAFLGSGQTHLSAKSEPMQEAVRKGLDWLIEIQNQNGNGDFHDLSAEKGRNPAFYAHSQATIAMCEAYALTKDRKLYAAAQKGVQYLLDSQQPNEGGWKYHPLDARSIGDLSVTGWVLMALHSARAAGIAVAEEPFQRASKFLNSVQDKDGARYRYQPTGWEVTRAMTAEGLLCRQFLGWPQTQPQLQEGVAYLLDEKYLPSWSEGRRNVYEWYYVGHVLHNMNDEEWTDWYSHAQKEIVENQNKTGKAGTGGILGSWHPHKPAGAPYEFADKAGRLYITAMCLLILEMPVRHQPIYED